MDELGDESDWATLEIAMPVNQQITIYSLFQRTLERFPNAFPILRTYLGYQIFKQHWIREFYKWKKHDSLIITGLTIKDMFLNG